jgi:hypothetical protein
MQSFVHMRKGRTSKRLHADLDDLKDDELGRGGFTGRKANVDAVKCGPGIAVPTLVIGNRADDACTDWLHRHGFSL